MTIKLTQRDADMMRVFKEEIPHLTQRALAAEYGVHPDTVFNVLHGKALTGEPRKPRRDRRCTTEEALEVRRLARDGMTQWHIARATGLPRHRVRNILEGITYQEAQLHEDGQPAPEGQPGALRLTMSASQETWHRDTIRDATAS